MMEQKESLEAEMLKRLKSLRSVDSSETDVGPRLQIENAFKKIHYLINEGRPVEEVLEHSFELLQGIIPYDRIGIAILEAEETALRLIWIKSNLPTEKLRKNFRTTSISTGLRKILETSRPRIINDLSEYFDTHPVSQTTPLILGDGIRSNLTCPLHVEGRNVGLIFFSSGVPYVYPENKMDLYQEVSECVSLIMKDYVESHNRRNRYEI